MRNYMPFKISLDKLPLQIIYLQQNTGIMKIRKIEIYGITNPIQNTIKTSSLDNHKHSIIEENNEKKKKIPSRDRFCCF